MENVLRSGPFTSVNGDRAYFTQFFTDYFGSFIGNGVFPNPSNGLQVMAGTGLEVIVKKGTAWVNGQIHLGDMDHTLTLETGDSLLPRLDKIVLRVDAIQRTFTKEVKKGQPRTNPVAPVLTRTDDMYELGLATILVNSTASTITQSNITDLRLNRAECGIVHGVVEQVDTTTIFNQYQTWFNEKRLEYGLEFDSTINNLEEEFNQWFQIIKEALDGDTAGNLLNLINGIPKVITSNTEPLQMVKGDIWLKELS